MTRYVEPFFLGEKKLANNIIYAPLAGCSDLPFRKMSCAFQPGLVFCEMTKMDALVRYDPNTFRLLDYYTSMHPIGAQVCGSKVELARPSAKIIEDLGFDVVDLNCGCPVDKVTKDGSGSGLLLHPDKIGDILNEMIQAVNIPVTLKIRVGWDEQNLNAVKITRIAEEVGAAAIFIHGRTRSQGYTGLARRDRIMECTEVAQSMPVIGNGDIFDVPSAVNMFEMTGCDGLLIARGCMGKPWMVEEIRRYYQNQEEWKACSSDYLMRHAQYIVRYRGTKGALLDLKRVGCWYLKQSPGAKSLRKQLTSSVSAEDALKVIDSFCQASKQNSFDEIQKNAPLN